MLDLSREPECDTDGRAPETVVLEVDAVALFLVDQRSEIPQVASQSYTPAQRVHHAAPAIESVVLLVSAPLVRPGTNDAEPRGAVRPPLWRPVNPEGY